MRKRGRLGRAAAMLGAVAGIALGGATLARGDAPALPSFATGLDPVDPAAYAALPGVTRFRAFLPPRVDLTNRFPTPGDQGQQGSCSAWATSYAARSFLASNEAAGGTPDDAVMSPAYVFNQTRPGPGCMRGTGLPQALTFLQQKGTVPKSEFSPPDCAVPPPAALGSTAAQYRIGGFQAVAHRNEQTGKTNSDWRDPIVRDDIKGALVRGRPVVFGMQLPSDFMVPLMGFTGIYRSTERYNRWGGSTGPMHAMALVGYDDTRQAFRLINSWSARWGDGGYLWIDYETFSNLVGEAYVVEPAREAAPPAPPPPPVVARETPQARLQKALDRPICGRLSVRWQGDAAVVEGFARPEDVALVQGRAGPLANVEWRVRPTPFPTCEAELMLSEGLVDGGVRLGMADAGGRALDAPVVTLRENALFSISVESAAKPYLQVFYLQADGSAVELYRGAPPRDAQGRRVVSVGAAGATARRFQVAPPFGDEALIAIASSGPIIAEPLGTQATERQFLSRLRAALVARRGERPSATLRRLRTVRG